MGQTDRRTDTAPMLYRFLLDVASGNNYKLSVTAVFIYYITRTRSTKKTERKTEGQNRQNISKYTDNTDITVTG